MTTDSCVQEMIKKGFKLSSIREEELPYYMSCFQAGQWILSAEVKTSVYAFRFASACGHPVYYVEDGIQVLFETMTMERLMYDNAVSLASALLIAQQMQIKNGAYKRLDHIVKLGYARVGGTVEFSKCVLDISEIPNRTSIGFQTFALHPVECGLTLVDDFKERRELEYYILLKYGGYGEAREQNKEACYDVKTKKIYLRPSQTKGDMVYMDQKNRVISVHWVPMFEGEEYTDAVMIRVMIADLKAKARQIVTSLSRQEERMYTEHVMWYDIHTYDERRVQMSEQLAPYNLEKRKVLAPCDGAGILKDMFPNVVSTDKFPRTPGVEKATLSSVIKNCKRDEVIVVAYGSYWMTDGDWCEIENNKKAVIFIDTHYMVQPFMHNGPPYVSFANLDSPKEIGHAGNIKAMEVHAPMYTDELLKQGPPYNFYSIDAAFHYVNGMAPMAPVTSSQKSTLEYMEKTHRRIGVLKDPPIVDHLRDLLALGRPAYLVSAGVILDPSSFIALRRLRPTALYTRTLYRFDGMMPAHLKLAFGSTLHAVYGNHEYMVLQFPFFQKNVYYQDGSSHSGDLQVLPGPGTVTYRETGVFVDKIKKEIVLSGRHRGVIPYDVNYIKRLKRDVFDKTGGDFELVWNNIAVQLGIT